MSETVLWERNSYWGGGGGGYRHQHPVSKG